MKAFTPLLPVIFLTLFLLAGTSALGSPPAPSPAPFTPEERETLTKEIETGYHKADEGSFWWSIAFHGCLFLAAGASASAALILKLDSLKDWKWRNDTAAILAGVAALLPLLSTSGGFNQKWLANRATRANLAALRLEVRLTAQESSSLSKDFVQRYEHIMAQHEQGIIANGNAPSHASSEKAGGPQEPSEKK